LFEKLGWKRNLVAEGIEPNPGPITWSGVRARIEQSSADDYKEDIQAFEHWLKEEKGLCTPNKTRLQKIKKDALLQLLQEWCADERKREEFKDVVIETISELTLGIKLVAIFYIIFSLHFLFTFFLLQVIRAAQVPAPLFQVSFVFHLLSSLVSRLSSLVSRLSSLSLSPPFPSVSCFGFF